MPPQDLTAEAHLLGAAMLDVDALEVALDVRVADFYKPAHRHIASALADLHGQGRAVDTVTVSDCLAQHDLLEAVGGHPTLVELMSTAPATSNAAEYARIVSNAAALRRLVAVSGEMAEAAYGGGDSGEVLARAAKLLAEAGAGVEPAGAGYRSTRLDTVVPERVRWLWPGKLPVGKLVTLDGDPDVGKSTLTLDVAARVTTGRAMPGEDLACVPASDVVLMAAEDGLADTIRPRLEAAGADVSRIHHFDSVPVRNDDGQVVAWDSPIIPDHVGALEALIVETGAVLVIVDVLMAYMSGRSDSHKDQDVRRALSPVGEVAARTGACIVLLRHVPKSQRRGGQAISAGTGSIGIIGAARVGMIAALDPDDSTATRRVLARAKGNLAPPWPSLAYQLKCGTCASTVCDTMDHGPARLEWLGKSTHSADSLLRHVGDEHSDDSDDAEAVLASLLADGPLWVKQAFDKMAEAGFSRDQTKRAKKKLKIRSDKFGSPGDPDQGWKWVLPEGSEGSEGSEGRNTGESAPFDTASPKGAKGAKGAATAPFDNGHSEGSEGGKAVHPAPFAPFRPFADIALAQDGEAEGSR